MTEERYLCNALIVDQEAVNRQPVAIVGIGATGSHLAEMLAKLGVGSSHWLIPMRWTR